MLALRLPVEVRMAGFFKKILGTHRMFDTFAHIGVAYQQDTGKDIHALLDVMGLSLAERRALIEEFDDRFGNSIASGNALRRAHAIDEAIEVLMELLMKKRPDFAAALHQ